MLVVVHGGCGRHSHRTTAQYTRICALACNAALEQYDLNGNAELALCAAVKVLEDYEETNAGTGSNLTTAGSVECDASIMSTASSPHATASTTAIACQNVVAYGSVAAVSRIKNPIILAHQVLLHQRQGIDSLGRIPPLLLVGDGAHEFASAKGIVLVEPSSLLTAKMKSKFERQMQQLEPHWSVSSTPLALEEDIDSDADITQNSRLDTVGAVLLDDNYQIVAGVSSGGISLKLPGRVGHAATYAAGCWGEGDTQRRRMVGVSCTGTGEYLMRMQFASQCARIFAHHSSHQALKALEKHIIHTIPPIELAHCLFGFILVKTTKLRTEVCFGHNAPSMVMAYRDNSMPKPKAIMSRLPPFADHDQSQSSELRVPFRMKFECVKLAPKDEKR